MGARREQVKMIGADDREGSGITWRYGQARGPAKYQGARIEIESEAEIERASA